MSRIRKVIYALLIVLGILVLLIVFHVPILSSYVRLFEVEDVSKGADAIICLSGGRLTRVPKALKLWEEGYGDSLYLTEQKPSKSEFNDLELSNLEFASEVAKRMRLNVNWSMLPSKSGGATSTFDEAEDVLAFGIKNKWERIILVTDSYHTGRALLAFEKVFKGQEVKLQITGARNEIFNERNWWKTDSGILAYFSETIKYPIYWLWDHEPKIVRND